jgi:hypothetical protein
MENTKAVVLSYPFMGSWVVCRPGPEQKYLTQTGRWGRIEEAERFTTQPEAEDALRAVEHFEAHQPAFAHAEETQVHARPRIALLSDTDPGKWVVYRLRGDMQEYLSQSGLWDSFQLAQRFTTQEKAQAIVDYLERLQAMLPVPALVRTDEALAVKETIQITADKPELLTVDNAVLGFKVKIPLCQLDTDPVGVKAKIIERTSTEICARLDELLAEAERDGVKPSLVYLRKIHP